MSEEEKDQVEKEEVKNESVNQEETKSESNLVPEGEEKALNFIKNFDPEKHSDHSKYSINEDGEKDSQSNEYVSKENGDSEEEDSIFSDDQVDRLRDLGFDDSKLNEFESKEALEAYLKIKEDDMRDAVSSTISDENADTANDQAQENKNDQNTTESIQKQVKDIDEKLKFIDESDKEYDSELINELKDMRQSMKSLLNRVQQSDEKSKKYDELIKNQEINEKRLEEERFINQVVTFEKNIEYLGDDFADVLGKGSADQVSKDQREKRIALWQEVEAQRASFFATGRTPPSEERLFKRAVQIELADEMKTIEKNKFLKKAKKQNNSIIRSPEQNKDDRQLTGEEKALKFIRKKQKEFEEKKLVNY